VSDEKEKLLQIGLDDLGRFAIGEDSQALYFDDAKLQDLPIARDEKLKRQIAEIVRDVVSDRFDNIESQLEQILARLSLLPRASAKTQMKHLVRPGNLRELTELSGEIEKLKRRLSLSKKAKRKQFRRQPSPTT
jgi:hypothetical protein